jgi:hypothetical protein
MEESKTQIGAEAGEPAAGGFLTTPELLGEIGSKAVLLARKEVDLAKQELKERVHAGVQRGVSQPLHE